MHRISAEPLELAAVEQEIAASGRWLKFAPAIEAAFRVKLQQDRIIGNLVASGAAIVLYDVFLINDWLALHDRFKEMLIARLFIFTPVLLILMTIGHRKQSSTFVEWATVAGSTLAVALPMSVMVYSTSSHKLSYQYGSMLVMMFSTVIQRVQFRPGAVAVVAMLVIQLTTTYVSEAFDTETYVAIVSFFGSAAALQLIAIYIMDRSDRHSFLFALRGRLLQDQLRRSAQVDALTGLYNRRHLADVQRELWAEAEPRSVSAILLDIDHFKRFNDTCGHLEGDTCLRTVSACILNVVKEEVGLAFRFGGEEMLIVLPGHGIFDARQIAEDIRREIAVAAIAHPALGEGAVVTASFGIADVIAPETSAADLLASTDKALYAAKRAGRNCVWPPEGRENTSAPTLALRRA